MYVNFKKLKFRNILSFGSQITEINFENGLNLITGKNGCGKSGSFLDPLSFCVFGKPYRKIKIRELVNRTNKKNLYTECEFDVGNESYKIIRTQLPDDVKIQKFYSEENDFKDLDLQSSKGLIQDEIDKLIGIDFNMFRQIIALAINYNKSFIEMDKDEKREIIESVTNVKVLREMLKKLKINLTNLKTQTQVNTSSIKILEENLFYSDKKLKELTNAKNNFETDKNNDLSKINESLLNQQKGHLKLVEDLEVLSVGLEVDDDFKDHLKAFGEELKTNNKTVSVENYKLEHSKKTLEFFETNDVCPSCKQNLDSDHKNSEKEILKKEIKESEKIIKSLEKKIKEIEKQKSDLEKKINTQNDLKNKIANVKEKIKLILSEIKENEKRKIAIENRKFDFDLEKMKEEFEVNTEKYLKLFEENEAKLRELNNLEIVSKIISDNGIKAYFFKNIMPILNKKINEYLEKFSLPIKIILDEVLDHQIIDNFTQKEIAYYGHSEGEKKRIDISIMLAFIDLTKLISNWDCSLFILDEIVDSKLDEEGREIVLNTIKDFTINNKNLCVYLISNVPNIRENEIFDSQIMLSKPNNFSKISKLF